MQLGCLPRIILTFVGIGAIIIVFVSAGYAYEATNTMLDSVLKGPAIAVLFTVGLILMVGVGVISKFIIDTVLEPAIWGRKEEGE